jgi:hypothetical protein
MGCARTLGAKTAYDAALAVERIGDEALTMSQVSG